MPKLAACSAPLPTAAMPSQVQVLPAKSPVSQASSATGRARASARHVRLACSPLQVPRLIVRVVWMQALSLLTPHQYAELVPAGRAPQMMEMIVSVMLASTKKAAGVNQIFNASPVQKVPIALPQTKHEPRCSRPSATGPHHHPMQNTAAAVSSSTNVSNQTHVTLTVTVLRKQKGHVPQGTRDRCVPCARRAIR